MRQMEAAQLLENKLLNEIFEKYRAQLYESWTNEFDRRKADDLRSRARAANELSKYIDNICEGIISGSDRARAAGE